MAAAVDIPNAYAMLRYMAGWATKLGGETIEPMSAPPGTFHAYVRREPVGVAAQIVPWNFPLLMAVLKIAPALAAGCTVVLKPAEQTSLTALRLADLVAEAGFPAGRGQHHHRHRRTRRATRWSGTRTSTRSPSPARPRSARSSTATRPTR